MNNYEDINKYEDPETVEAYEDDGSCVITCDEDAERFLNYEKKRLANLDRLLALCDAEQQRIQSKRAEIEDKKLKSFYREQLNRYFMKIGADKKRKTKTSERYDLLSGKLVRKFGGFSPIRDNSKLTEWALETAPDCVEMKPSLKWAELKKQLVIDADGAVYKPTGEVVEGIQVEQTPDTFVIEIEKEGGALNG